jgi:mevalonate kinase
MWNQETSDFSLEVPAKWVLSGEHSVLRGGRAIAFPHPVLSLKLKYFEKKSNSVLSQSFSSELRSLIARACEFLGKDADVFSTGAVEIESSIPMGSGLGSSAAVSVAMAKLVIWKTGASSSALIPLATHLEHVFHGKSSGMDVNVIAHAKPILFSMEKKVEAILKLERLPRFEFQDTGLRGQTKLCIERVNLWRMENLSAAQEFDSQMGRATERALSALQKFQADPQSGERALALSMQASQNCFETWGLVPRELLEQKNELLAKGALAVRMTGAGLGGFWVALWPSAKLI